MTDTHDNPLPLVPESGVPLPSSKPQRANKFKWEFWKHGDSLFSTSPSFVSSAHTSLRNWKKSYERFGPPHTKPHHRLISRKEGEGWRIWLLTTPPEETL